MEKGPLNEFINILDIKHKFFKLCNKGTLKNNDFWKKNINEGYDWAPYLQLAWGPSLSNGKNILLA